MHAMGKLCIDESLLTHSFCYHISLLGYYSISIQTNCFEVFVCKTFSKTVVCFLSSILASIFLCILLLHVQIIV